MKSLKPGNKKPATRRPTLRIRKNGHRHYKSSDCPTCPACEAEKKPKEGCLSKLAAPARRAFENAGISTIQQLSKHSESSILKLQSIGQVAIPIEKKELKKAGLTFND